MSGFSNPLSVHEILAHQEFLRSLARGLVADASDGIAVTPADLVLRGAGGGKVDLVRADSELRATMLVPGEYVLVVVGSGLAARETPVSIKAGSHMTVSVLLEPGIPRTLRFEKQGGGVLAGPVTWTASDASGAELHGTLQIEPGAASAELTLSLAIGEWSLEASGADGARAETLFAVSRRQPEADAVVVALGR